MSGLDGEGNSVCEPLDTLQDVINWSSYQLIPNCRPTHLNHQISESVDGHLHRQRPQVLVCHDMKGGYLEDRFAQGCDNPSAYRFYHWWMIDTFVYFSHRFVTIPPIGWICAAHTNGVQVLGTIITEWEEGAKICRELLASKETIELVSAKLAEIAHCLGFDGWLVNIENVVEEQSIPDLQYFVQHLTQQCHRLMKHSKVLWYDSVTQDGRLDWQNELNENNQIFFSVCDGIFLNYAITDEKLVNSRVKAASENRHFDVYVGVDVFGRATPGGGGFNSKHVLEKLSRHQLSCALFAQGWVYETHGAECFDEKEEKFWRLLRDYLPERCIKVPFSTSFCQGYGKRRYFEGKIISERAWHNLSLQQLQPTASTHASLTTGDAYRGGGCLRIASPNTNLNANLALTKLFTLCLQEGPLTVSAVWKNCKSLRDPTHEVAFVLTHTHTLHGHSTMSVAKAIILTHINYQPDKETQQSFLSGISDQQIAVETDAAEFVFGVHSGKSSDSCGWTTSRWEVNLTSKDGRGHLNLYVVLVPQRKGSLPVSSHDDASHSDCVLLGNIQMQMKGDSSTTKHGWGRRSHLTCLEVNAAGMLSGKDVLTVSQELQSLLKTAQPESSTPVQAGTESLTSVETLAPALESAGNRETCVFKCCRLVTLCGQEAQQLCLHILKWTACHLEQMDYYIVFSLNDDGGEQFVGCTRTNSFVNLFNSCDSDRERTVVTGYKIQIVLFGQGSFCHTFFFSKS